MTETQTVAEPELPRQQLVGTPIGRRALDLVAVVLVGSMFISSLPSSGPRDELRVVERPVTDVTGLSQNWALFAPTPRSTTLRLRAEIERADGSVTEWFVPTADPFVGVYRTYRWRKWANYVVDPDRSRLHRGAIAHLRARFDDPETPISEIRLYRGTFSQPRPGSGLPADRDPVFEEELLRRAVFAGRGDDGSGT
ncbi:MAG: hypothetical protein WEB09_02530 [Nitriliruptor sp.]